eukprot:gene10179-8085_t
MLALPAEGEDDELVFLSLDIEDLLSQMVNLKLGLVASMKHYITVHSPLYGLSLEQMDTRGIEILCFVDGVDPMTSKSISAHRSYNAAQIRMNEHLESIGLQHNERGSLELDFEDSDSSANEHFESIGLQHNERGSLGLNFEDFDSSAVAKSIDVGADDEILYPVAPSTFSGARCSKEYILSHMADLRKHTIRELSMELPPLSSPSHSYTPSEPRGALKTRGISPVMSTSLGAQKGGVGELGETVPSTPSEPRGAPNTRGLLPVLSTSFGAQKGGLRELVEAVLSDPSVDEMLKDKAKLVLGNCDPQNSY